MVYLTGFADEAADDLEGQIRATRELGWQNIESRNIGGQNIHNIPEAEFETVCARLAESGVHINCFGSAIANWGKRIDEPFETSWAEALRAVPRMQRLGTRLVRIMSFAVLEGREPDDQMETERFRRLRELQALFSDAGIQAVHENCMNYGGMGWPYTLRLLDNVPGLRLVFDTGNPVFLDDRTKAKPYPKQSAWEFYSHVKEHIAYLHIKDGRFDPQTGQTTYTFAGEGDAEVPRILEDLLKHGYDGGISIEPHLGTVFHDAAAGKAADEARYAAYVEYGRRVDKMIRGIQESLGR
ncbi:MAG TPA: TIM barrel protein [Candidatus Sumerlaeota bacterium]|nr:TIM barrel protein [Candidatus Sumerlaeota bacterium]